MSDCDIPTPNGSRSDELRIRRDVWMECLNGNDRNSVVKQIWGMIWNAAAFRVINEARGLAPTDHRGRVQLNGLIHGLLNVGFFTSQQAAIRRLTDGSKLDGARGVYSLTSLIQDIQQHSELFTRENMFAAEGLRYDCAQVQAELHLYQQEHIRNGESGFMIPPELCVGRFEERHAIIDRLSGASPDNRSPDDRIRPNVFTQLQDRLDAACGNLNVHVNKFVAHAATPVSRAEAGADDISITLGHLWRAQQTICEVASFVSVVIIGGPSNGYLAHAPDSFAHIDKPLVSTTDISRLVEKWDEFDHETRKWTAWGLDEFEQELRQ